MIAKRSNTGTMKGRYIPKHPQKIIGNPNNIIFRSSWELNVMKFFDMSVAVKRWGSEILQVKYLSPKDGRVHTYFPDFYCEFLDVSGKIVKEIIEVKPLSQSNDLAAKSVYDKQALVLNKAKWAAATAFAAAHGMSFRVITEQSIFKQVQKKPRAVKKPRKIITAKTATKPRSPKK